MWRSKSPGPTPSLALTGQRHITTGATLRIRFFVREVRSWRRMTPSVTRWSRKVPPRRFGYPLSVRWQVHGVQSPLPCFGPTVLYSRRPPSLRRVPPSAVPRHHRHYEGATTSRPRIPASLFCSVTGPTRSSFVRARRSAPDRPGGSRRAWNNLSAGVPSTGVRARGRERDLTGSLAIRPMPLP